MPIESFFQSHQFTINALTAFGTLLAVAASVVIAWGGARSNRTRIKASADVMVVYRNDDENPADRPRYIAISITNVGNLPCRIEFSFFAWKLPFQRKYWQILPLDHFGDALHAKVQYPVEIAPRAYHRAYVSDLETFRSEVGKIREATWPWPLFQLRQMRAVVTTSDGREFSAFVTRRLRGQVLKALEEKRG